MKRKLMFLWALLIGFCAHMSAQTWTWTGETPAAGDWYLYHPNWGFIHADANSSYPTTNVAAATRFTITATGTTATKLAYKVGTTTYYLNNNSGNMSINTTGSNLYVRIGNANDGYYITTYSATSLNTSGSGDNRYLNVWDGGAAWSRGNGGNKTQWRFISPKQMAKQLSNNSSLTNPFDFTAAIINPGFEDGTWNNGWTTDGFVEHGNDGKFVGSHIAEMWSGDLVSGSIKQTVNLPQGVYILKAKIAAGFDGTEQYLYAKTTAETRKAYVVGKTDDPAEYHEVMFRVLPGDNGQAEIGFVRDNIRWWTGVDDFTLQYVGETPAFTYEMGTRLDGSYLSRPAYTSTPADGVDPENADKALLVVTWPNENTNDPWSTFKIADGAQATITAEGVNTTADLLASFRSSTYHNGFGLYIPNFDEKKTYTVTIPAGSIGFATANGNAYDNGYANVMNEVFTINAKQSPIKDGKYFIRMAGTTKHVSRGGHYGTQAILDNYGVPVLVQTAGLTVFKFLDNNAFLGSDPSDDWLYTDCFDERTRRYNLIPDNEENPTKVKFFTPARNKYLYHANDEINGVTYEKMVEGDEGDWYDFERFTQDGYNAHLLGIEDAEAKRVAERAGYTVKSFEEYNQLIADLETKGATNVWPKETDDYTKSEAYHEARNNDLPVDPVWGPAPKDLIGAGERLTLTLNRGLYVVKLNAFQQASALAGLQQNFGFRGLVYYYAKVGDVMYKSQLKSITETTGSIPTTEELAKTALAGDNYLNQIVFYVPANGTNVEFGVQNPQRLGNGIDATAGSWVAFQNLKIETFGDVVEANMKVTAGKYGTFIAPFAVTLPDGVTAYSGALNSERTSVALTSVAAEGTELDACTPVVIYNDGTQDVNMTYREVDVRNDKTTVTEQKGVFVGFYKSYAEDNAALIDGANGTSWVLQTQNGKQAFYKVDPNGTFQGSKNRCYMVAPAAASVKMLGFTFAEEVETGIENFSNSLQGENTIFDLSGRRVNKAQKGIYIINGKKVVK